jgi:hypothetical protein
VGSHEELVQLAETGARARREAEAHLLSLDTRVQFEEEGAVHGRTVKSVAADGNGPGAGVENAGDMAGDVAVDAQDAVEQAEEHAVAGGAVGEVVAGVGGVAVGDEACVAAVHVVGAADGAVEVASDGAAVGAAAGHMVLLCKARGCKAVSPQERVATRNLADEHTEEGSHAADAVAGPAVVAAGCRVVVAEALWPVPVLGSRGRWTPDTCLLPARYVASSDLCMVAAALVDQPEVSRSKR